MTDQLFAEDAYLTSCEATVVDIRDEGVILDRTVFYARGGGQPGDTGLLRWEGGQSRVVDTLKLGGDIVHQLDGESHEMGQEIENKLNEELAKDRPVHVSFLPRSAALSDPDLIRTKVNL